MWFYFILCIEILVVSKDERIAFFQLRDLCLMAINSQVEKEAWI